MDFNRLWNILCWNVRGLNDQSKWDLIRDKIDESGCSLFCFQETKMEDFNAVLLRKFAPRRFDSFVFSPSEGASGGILVAWNSKVFSVDTVDCQPFALSMNVISAHDMQAWKLITVYGPTKEPARLNFVSWLYSQEILLEDHLLLLGDFNFYRTSSNRNKPGGNAGDMLVFNDIIHTLGLVELPLKGRSYTWSNMQEQPLLQQLDWFFTSPAWNLTYPNTTVLPLAKIVSDHTPCKVQIGTSIPKANLFRYENYWPLLSGFLETVSPAWMSTSNSDAAKSISSKFKALRSALKSWSSSKSNLQILTKHCNMIIAFLDELEEIRPLFLPERNFRFIIQEQLRKLLNYQQIYWKQRYTEKLVKWGDENTKFFHARATERYRHNVISQITASDGRLVVEHSEKAALFWNEFKGRMGISVQSQMIPDLQDLLPQHDLQDLVIPFSWNEIDEVAKSLPIDKAPGPDGFNGHFIKKVWSLIKYDFYRLCSAFYHHQADLKSINYSYITLVPKKSNPERVQDFRPISLLNSSMKFLTKILANRLQTVILRVICRNQYGFLQGRTI